MEKILNSDQQITQSATELKKMKVIYVLILAFITFGLYYPIWLLKRRNVINNMQSSKKLKSGAIILLIMLWVIGLLIGVASASMGTEQSTQNPILSLLNVVFVIVLLTQSFKVRYIFDEHFNKYLQRGVKFSKVATFFFQILYFQYKINRL